MSIEIDWAWVLVNPHFVSYVRDYDVINLSLVNKKIRTKLYSNIFKNLEINENFFKLHFNSDKCDYHLFDNLSIDEDFKLFRKYGYNNELKFKEVLLGPFIEKNKKSLNLASKYSFDNFLNLRRLSAIHCEIKYTDFANLLVKLENLEVLIMNDMQLILSPDESTNLSNNLQLPLSLKELTYINVGLRATDYYQSMGMGIDMEMEQNSQFYLYNGFDLKATLLPNLKILKFLDANPDAGRIRDFIDLNPNMKYINAASIIKI
ncbi:hypothetical protein CONCODRAFT_13032 [Conidiobolus coronatus NRRL 28638]|uniref:Uncharacterized protein n=1 Tax=Conidiobolus coronatus (strain ATCC 28846 / CBS 209.66 / NRRL 28638) TaxID=796925 RepID=A0A137NRL7_CONC2|nr:hypothetical protein CONCODRAFT_13032 [Conidiobolus coronatus NRRL 28638]|eukprot:KXN65385.1 hypothetical protein CONCODRAFT_13032 [Conidiobolus coronatus NRRL 28638]